MLVGIYLDSGNGSGLVRTYTPKRRDWPTSPQRQESQVHRLLLFCSSVYSIAAALFPVGKLLWCSVDSTPDDADVLLFQVPDCLWDFP